MFWWLLLAFLWFLGFVILLYALTRDTPDHCDPDSKECNNCPFPRCEKRNNSKGEK